MKKISSVIVLLALLATGFTASAQRVPANTAPIGKTKVEAPSAVINKGTVLKSGIKSLGTIGSYEVVQVKVRGLDTPNLVSVLLYDSRTGDIVSQQSATGPGIGAAIVNGGANVGASYLFGSKIRPDTTSVSAGGGDSSATGGNASSDATGGAGGNANATGGNGNGGAGGSGGTGGSGGNGGGGWVPPGHQGGHPGNGPKK